MNVNTYSSPSDLKITDIRVAEIDGAPKRCTLLKVMTNQGLVGYGEVRDASSRTYALMLKSRLLGENPCNVDRLFRRIKQFGGHSRQGGGVSGIEIALWDLAGKAFGVPLYQMLGGKFRDEIRVYCDTDVDGKHTGRDMGKALKKRMEMGFTFLKMDMGINLLMDVPGALNAPLGVIEEYKHYRSFNYQGGSLPKEMMSGKYYDCFTRPHAMSGIHLTDIGLEYLENYIREVRDEIGYEVPLAIDHVGHISVNDCIRLGKMLEKYSIAWLEDVAPWQNTADYVKIASNTTTPICTGEDIYLKENFEPLMASGGVSVIHPDILTCGGALELKKIGELCEKYSVAMAIHMAESPIACMAAVHAAAAMPNVLAMEYHSVDVDWWNDIALGIANPLIQNGFITVPDAPGLGIEALNEELIKEHLHKDFPIAWGSTDEWNNEWSNDRIWS